MEKTGRTFLYFGFGSNLWSKRIRLENPSAEFVAVAELADYQLQFRYPSKRWGGCAATVTSAPGNTMYGVLWRLGIENLPTLDHQEGVQLGIYRRISVRVKSVPAGEDIDGVITYVVTDEKLRPEEGDCRPSRTYKSVILNGARENKLPAEYVAWLESIEDNGHGAEQLVDADLPAQVVSVDD